MNEWIFSMVLLLRLVRQPWSVHMFLGSACLPSSEQAQIWAYCLAWTQDQDTGSSPIPSLEPFSIFPLMEGICHFLRLRVSSASLGFCRFLTSPNPRPKAWVFLSCKMKMVIVVIHLVRLPVAPRHHSESTESIFPGLWEAWQSIHVQSLGPTPTSLPLTGRVHLGTYTRACVRTQS